MLIAELFESFTFDNKTVDYYFETAKGSKYFLSSKGESKRLKAVRANHPGDSGSKDWYSVCVFTNANLEGFFNKLFDFFSESSHSVYLTFPSRREFQWNLSQGGNVPLTLNDLNWVKKGDAGGNKPVKLPFSKEPIDGSIPFEMMLSGTRIVNIHFGNKITKVVKASDMTPEQKNMFGAK